MQKLSHGRTQDGDSAERANQLFLESQQSAHVRADRLFAKLMALQWVAGIGAALWISPRTWIGTANQTHWHVWAAIFLGAAISSLPIFLAWRHPGRPLTRHVIAVAQMLTSALWIHLTGGRIETHFHVFGSLAFLAFYRDWRVLLTATVVVALDHAARGIFWPQSVFGILTPSPWRWLEHAAWVIFEDTFLFIFIKDSLHDMFEAASHRARLESVNATIERQVHDRTAELVTAHHELQASEQRFRMLSACAPIGIFEADKAGDGLYTNDCWQKIAGLTLTQSLGTGWQQAIHEEDRERMLADWNKAVAEGAEFDGEYRFQRSDGEVRWIHVRSAPTRSKTAEITGHVGTVEDITERKRAERELEAAHKELLQASRRAGMAEVATGVLHNVGNVLNSVNVASTCLTDIVRKSKLTRLSQVATMLRENEADLAGFLQNDPKGRHIPGYLKDLSAQLVTEQSQVLEELKHLQKNIGHIKDIVFMQQSYANVSGVLETLPITELVEDALRINSSNLARQDVRVQTDFEGSPSATVDKHKVLQILVNLVRNAQQACEDSGRADKELTLRVRAANEHVSIIVTDNGVGIPPENLTRIFSHGFTTRKNGHGFGLHSGALAAQEMGGSVRAESQGTGRGATFTLELPCAAQNGSRQPRHEVALTAD